MSNIPFNRFEPGPRTHPKDEHGNFGYPFMNTMSGNTPERFQEVLALTKQRMLADPRGAHILNLNVWNEWTEGSYLEPDIMNGWKYLEAIRDVFGPNEPTKPASRKVITSRSGGAR